MIKFIYTGTIDDVPLDTVRGHLHLVTTYKLEMMGPLVQKRLSDSLSAANCVKILLLSLAEPILLELKEMAIQTIINYPFSHSHEIGFSSQVPSGLSLIHISPFKSSYGKFNISFFRITHSLIELTTTSDFVPGPSTCSHSIFEKKEVLPTLRGNPWC
mgnify:CR=1 FL=1